MINRKLLYITHNGDKENPLVTFSVYDPNRKIEFKPHFYALADVIARLPETGYCYEKDIRSYMTASIVHGNRLRLEFTWIEHEDNSGNISGRIETVHIRWEDMERILYADNTTSMQYKLLDIGPETAKPKITFVRTENLKRVLEDPILRRRISKALMSNFNYPGADEIRMYNDCEPHSFFFEEIRNGQRAMCGGLILHKDANPRRTNYSVHT